MATKIEHLERTVLELGTEIYRVKYRIESVEKENSYFRDLFISLRNILDEKGVINLDEFDEAIAIDRILARQAGSANEVGPSHLEALKKAIN